MKDEADTIVDPHIKREALVPRADHRRTIYLVLIIVATAAITATVTLIYALQPAVVVTRPQPAEPGQPVQPEEPVQPEQPVQPVQPEEPVQPDPGPRPEPGYRQKSMP